MPHVCMPHTFLCTHMFVCLRGVHAPYSFMPLCFWRLCMLWGGCNGLPFVLGHPPYIRGWLHLLHPPHSVVGSLCIGMFEDISVLYWHFLLSVKVWGCFLHLLGGGGASALEMSICSFLYLFL